MSGTHKNGSALLVAVLGTILLLASSPARAEFDFETWRPYPAGDDPYALVMSDMNNDGLQDLAVVNTQEYKVSILLGDGDGGFQAPRRADVPEYANSVAAGDLDGDGNADLAVASGSGLQILPGNGDGTVQPGSLLMTGTAFSDIAIADIDDDDVLDLVAIASSDSAVAVLLGDGDGTFQAALYSDTTNGGRAVAIGLLNNDQFPDLAVSGWDGAEILLGNGDGTFQAPVLYSAGEDLDSVAIGDLDGDGDIDLTAANSNHNELSVLLGQGDGTFSSPDNYPVGLQPWSVVVADMDDDGNLDLVSANSQGCTASLLLGNGDGTFQPAVDHWAGSVPRDLAASDFDGDGSADLALLDYGSDSVCVLIGRGDGSFISPTTVSVGERPLAAVLADFDRDGILDAATANYESESVSVLLGDGQGGFGPAADYGLATGARWIVADDLDNDGAMDLAVFLSYNTVSVFLGNGDGTFQSAVLYPCGNYPEQAIAEDLNGDTYPDLAICDHENSTLIILLNNGDGTFPAPVVYEDILILPSCLLAVDVDFDGDLDLAVPSNFAWVVTFFLNSGDGTFENHTGMYAGDYVSDIVAADLNGDTIPDLVVSDGDELLLCLGRPEGFFDDPIAIPADYASSIIAEDLDGDGHLDLAVANEWDHMISIVRGYGDGTFSAPLFFGAAGTPFSLDAGDLDGDGRLDLVMTNRLGNELAILINGSDINRLAIAGPGPGYENPPLVRVFNPGQSAEPLVEFPAYGPEHYGVNVTCGNMSGTGQPVILTGAGPGEIYGPHVRGFTVQGQPLGGLSFFAYGTLKYGVNVAAGDLDGDGYDEIITGAGPGAVFGPHVRAWDYDGTPGVTSVPGVSYFAYGTPKWGVNVAAGDIDGDGYDEIVTGPGPGNIYGPHVRGWNIDGGSASAISGVSYLAYGTNKKGVKVTCGDVDGDGIDEIVTAPGPSSFFASHVRGWNYDGAVLSAISGISFFAWPADTARYGANVEAGTDLDGDGRADLLVGGGPDPSIGTEVKVFTYDGSQVSEWVAFEAFPGMTGGSTVATGGF